MRFETPARNTPLAIWLLLVSACTRVDVVASRNGDGAIATDADLCASVSCAGPGRCVVAEGAARCVCDPGYHLVGTACEPGSSPVPASWQRIGDAEELALPDQFLLSPDGRYVAYLAIRQREDNGFSMIALKLVDRQTGQEQTLADTEDLTTMRSGPILSLPILNKRLVGFSPDSRFLYVLTMSPVARTLHELATGNSFEIPSDLSVAGFAPNGNPFGQQPHLDLDDVDIVLFDPDERTTSVLLHVDAGRTQTIQYAFGGSATKPILVAAFYEGHERGHRVLRSVPLSGGPSELIAEETLDATNKLSLLGASTNHVVYSVPTDIVATTVFYAPLAGGSARELGETTGIPRMTALSPSGKRFLWRDDQTNVIHVASLDDGSSQTVDGEGLGLQGPNIYPVVFTGDEAFAYVVAGTVRHYALTSKATTTIGPGQDLRQENGRVLFHAMPSGAGGIGLKVPSLTNELRIGELRLLDGSSSVLIGADIDDTSLSQWSGQGDHLLVSVMYFDQPHGMTPGPANGLYVVPLGQP